MHCRAKSSSLACNQTGNLTVWQICTYITIPMMLIKIGVARKTLPPHPAMGIWPSIISLRCCLSTMLWVYGLQLSPSGVASPPCYGYMACNYLPPVLPLHPAMGIWPAIIFLQRCLSTLLWVYGLQLSPSTVASPLCYGYMACNYLPPVLPLHPAMGIWPAIISLQCCLSTLLWVYGLQLSSSSVASLLCLPKDDPLSQEAPMVHWQSPPTQFLRLAFCTPSPHAVRATDMLHPI